MNSRTKKHQERRPNAARAGPATKRGRQRSLFPSSLLALSLPGARPPKILVHRSYTSSSTQNIARAPVQNARSPHHRSNPQKTTTAQKAVAACASGGLAAAGSGGFFFLPRLSFGSLFPFLFAFANRGAGVVSKKLGSFFPCS
jgi:hypothetical protein